MNIPQKISEVDNSFGKALSILSKSSFLLGGTVLVFYAFKINYIPLDFNLSEIFSLIILSIIFGVFSIFMLSYFNLIANIIINIFIKFINFEFLNTFYFIKKIKKIYIIKYIIIIGNKVKMSKSDFLFYAIFITFISLFIIGFKIVKLFDFISILAVMVILKYTYYWTNYEIIEKYLSDKEYDKNKKQKFLKSSFFIVIVLIFAIFILPRITFINHIMNISNIRSYNVSLHVKDPYYKIFEECNVPLSTSSFGEGYRKVEKANIDLQNVGKNIVINTSHIKDGCKKVVIPKLHDNIFVIDK